MIQKISNWASEHIGFDGLLHFAISATGGAILKLLLGPIAAFFIMLLIGLGKELYDHVTNSGVADWKDVLCDITGLFVGLI